MKRKVIRQGHNTLTITLPAKWAELNSIRAGDEIELEELNKSLVLKKGNGQFSKKSLTINLKSEDYQFIRLILNNVYRRGIDVLKINYKSDKQFEHIQDISNSNFLGFEVVRKEKEYCILENIAEPKDMELSVLMRRIFLIVKETLIFIEDELNKKGPYSHHYVTQQARKIEQFDNFCRRLISKGRISDPEDSFFYWMLLYYILLIGRGFLHLYNFLKESKPITLSKGSLSVMAGIRESFVLFYDSFFKKDFDGIADSNTLIKKVLYIQLYDALSKTKGREVVVLFWIGEIARMISLFISPSIEICFSKDIEIS